MPNSEWSQKSGVDKLFLQFQQQPLFRIAWSKTKILFYSGCYWNWIQSQMFKYFLPYGNLQKKKKKTSVIFMTRLKIDISDLSLRRG